MNILRSIVDFFRWVYGSEPAPPPLPPASEVLDHRMDEVRAKHRTMLKEAISLRRTLRQASLESDNLIEMISRMHHEKGQDGDGDDD